MSKTVQLAMQVRRGFMPYVTTEAMTLHLKETSQNVQRGAHAGVIIDGAGWHIAHDLLVPDNISLLPLPPFSSELNAQVLRQLSAHQGHLMRFAQDAWRYLRQNYLAGRIFDTYTSIVDAWLSRGVERSHR